MRRRSFGRGLAIAALVAVAFPFGTTIPRADSAHTAAAVVAEAPAAARRRGVRSFTAASAGRRAPRVASVQDEPPTDRVLTDALVSGDAGADRMPAVAGAAADGTHLVVWEHDGCIRGQRLDPAGSRVGAPIEVSCPEVVAGTHPAVAYSPRTGAWLVVWQAARNGECDIHGRIVGPDGTLVQSSGSPVRAAVAPEASTIAGGPGDDVRPDVAFGGDAFLVVWIGDGADGSRVALGALVGEDGSVGVAPFEIGASPAMAQAAPAVAYSVDAGEHLVAYATGDPPGSRIVARRVRANGLPRGDEIAVSSENVAGAPDVAATADGRFFVVWEATAVGGDADVFARSIAVVADGWLAGDAFTICAAAGNQTLPAVAGGERSDRLLVVFQDDALTAASGLDVVASPSAAEPGPCGGIVVAGRATHERAPTVSWQEGGGHLVVWQADAGAGADIAVQRLSSSGSLLGPPRDVSAAIGRSGAPAVAPGPGQYLTVWADSGSGSIRARRTDGAGRPLEEPWLLASGGEPAHPALVFGDRYLAVWHDRTAQAIEAAAIPPFGTALERFRVAAGVRTDGPVAMALADAESAVVVWVQAGVLVGGRLVREGDRWRAEGPPVILVASGAHGRPALAAGERGGGCAIAWEEDRGTGSSLHVGRLVPGGLGLTATQCVAGCSAGERAGLPSLAYGGEPGQFLLVHEGWDVDGPHEVRAVSLDGDARPVSDARTIGVAGPGGPVATSSPVAAWVPGSASFYVAWSRPSAGAVADLLERWLGPGAPDGPERLAGVARSGDERMPSLAAQPEGSAVLLAWADGSRPGAADVYVRLRLPDEMPPVAAFVRQPSVGRPGDVFTFDARPSVDDRSPSGALAVRWDWGGDGIWDTEWSEEKVATRTLSAAGLHPVVAEVRDESARTATVTHGVAIPRFGHSAPPLARVAAEPGRVSAGGTIRFDATASVDPDRPSDSLFFRWDWENDGVFDTGWSFEGAASLTPTRAGRHAARVEVGDLDDMTASAIAEFQVVPGTLAELAVWPRRVVLWPHTGWLFVAHGADGFGNPVAHPGVVWSAIDARGGRIRPDGQFTAGRDAGCETGVQASAGGLTANATVCVTWPWRLWLPTVQRQ